VKDSTSYGGHGQAQNGPSPTTDGLADGGGDFDRTSTDQAIRIGEGYNNGWDWLDPDDAITVEIWFKPHVERKCYIFCHRNPDHGYVGWTMGGWYSGTNQLRWQLYGIDRVYSNKQFSSDDLNKWWYIVGTYDREYMKIYVNGTLNCTPKAATAAIVDNQDCIWISFRSDNRGVDGVCDEFRVSDIARTPDWLAACYLTVTDSFLTYGNEANLKLAFTTEGQTLVQNEVSSIITAQLQDPYGTAMDAESDITVNLATSSSGGTFSENPTSWSSVNSVTIEEGEDSVSFYYKDTDVGTPTITASADDITSAEQQFTIKSSVNSFLVEATSPQIAGSAFTLTITALNDEGGVAEGYSDPVTISCNYISPSSGTQELSVTSTSNFTNGVATITNQTYPDAGTITITVIKTGDETKAGTSNSIVFIPYDFTVEVSELDASITGSNYTNHTTAKPFTLTVTARNASAATCANYKGTAELSADYIDPSTDQDGSFSTDSLSSEYWSDGIAEITTQTYDKWGVITITATDSTLDTQTGTSEKIVFLPKDFAIDLSDIPLSRDFYYTYEAFDATVTARGYDDIAIPNYQGTITFTSDGLNVPSDYTFTATDLGTHIFRGINGQSPTSTTITVTDTTYTSITGTSSTMALQAGTIKVYNASGPVGSIAVVVRILDAAGNIITSDDSTTFTIDIAETGITNNSCTSDTTQTPAQVTEGIATITLTNTEAESVTVTPSSTPSLTATSGTVRFGTVSGGGVGIQLWREIKEPVDEE